MVFHLFRNTADNPRLWRRLANVWTVIFLGAIVLDLILPNTVRSTLGILAAIYITCLAIYSAEKEFERWHEYYNARHPGEVYIVIWTLLIFILLAAQIFSQGKYIIPDIVTTTYIVVLGILAITAKSKRLFQEHSHEKKEI